MLRAGGQPVLQLQQLVDRLDARGDGRLVGAVEGPVGVLDHVPVFLPGAWMVGELSWVRSSAMMMGSTAGRHNEAAGRAGTHSCSASSVERYTGISRTRGSSPSGSAPPSSSSFPPPSLLLLSSSASANAPRLVYDEPGSIILLIG